ncbi:MAG: PAS domain S-box protein [Nitrospirae bacterium]|nr:MAG: PAS domain S-box protein [Nitrospirota bacterium]
MTAVKRLLPPLNLKGKTILAMVLVGLLPLILSLLLTYFEERRALRTIAGINFKGIAVELARKIETQITRSINEAQQLATIPFIRTAVTESNRSYEHKNADEIAALIQEWRTRWRSQVKEHEFPPFVNQYATNYLVQWHAIRKSDYLAILVTDNRGALVLSSFPQVKFFHGNQKWWQAVVQQPRGQIYVSDLFFDPSFGTHVLNIAVPILDDRQQSVVGAISILLRRDSLFQSIAEVTAGETGHGMLVASDGTPLLCPILSLEAHSVTPQLARAIGQPEPGWVMAEPDSHGKFGSIVGFAPMHLGLNLAPESFGGREWRVVVRQDPTETFAPLNQLLTKVVTYGGAVFVVLWVTGVLVAGRVVRPIELLYEGVQRIGQGDWGHHLTICTGDEIERLAQAFNAMAGNLKDSFAQLNQKVAEIAQLQEKYRDLIENSPEMIHQLDRTGRFVHVNQTELQKLGYSLEEMLQMSITDIVPEERKQDLLAYLDALGTEHQRSIETVFLTRRGEAIDVEIHSTPFVDPESGIVVYSRGFVRDITERKILQREIERYTTRLEEQVRERTRQLSESETRYKALFDLAADSIVVVDERGRIQAVNDRQRDALGYDPAALLGRSVDELIEQKDRAPFAQLFDQVKRGGRKAPTREFGVYHANGSVVPMEIDLIRVDVGHERSVMVQLRDIAERKRLETKLQQYSESLEEKVQERTREIEQAKHYIENLLENANDVIYTLDEEQRFTYVNSRIETWGYAKDDVLGRPYLSILSKRYRGRHLEDMLAMSEKRVYEVEVASRQGETRSVLVSVSPLRDEQGQPTGVLGIARDITERKVLEQQVRNAERLASIGKLAAGVAHEINNPLGGILNCLYNIRKGMLSPARAEEYMHYMEDGLRRVQKIVRQLLDFSQQHDPELTPTDLNALVERVLVLTDHALRAKQLTLVRECDPVGPTVLVDPHMIEQVLMNLILNAVHAMDPGGCLTIRTRFEDTHCEIHVADTGCGISPDIRPHIFDPFFTTKKTGEGTGLGLSVSLGIVERHGGEMMVESEIGKGTVFIVRLPIGCRVSSKTGVV